VVTRQLVHAEAVFLAGDAKLSGSRQREQPEQRADAVRIAE
jgi:hypothetical protein